MKFTVCIVVLATRRAGAASPGEFLNRVMVNHGRNENISKFSVLGTANPLMRKPCRPGIKDQRSGGTSGGYLGGSERARQPLALGTLPRDISTEERVAAWVTGG